MDLGDAVRVAMNESEAVGSGRVAIIGERLAGRVVWAHPPGQGRIPRRELRSTPYDESRRVDLQYRRKRSYDQNETKCHDYRGLLCPFPLSRAPGHLVGPTSGGASSAMSARSTRAAALKFGLDGCLPMGAFSLRNAQR